MFICKRLESDLSKSMIEDRTHTEPVVGGLKVELAFHEGSVAAVVLLKPLL